MRIVHYSLGLYPSRTGGLNRYVTDLIREQSKSHHVALIYPNGYRWWSKVCYISKLDVKNGINCYKLVNAHPIPLMYGIKNPKDFSNLKISQTSFQIFYNDFRPDVLHLHTLMGLSEEMLKFFKDRNVKIIYTSHDYFGICPKVNLINELGDLCAGPDMERCSRCNMLSPSTFYLRLRNSTITLKLRDLIRWIKNINCL